MRQSFLGVQSNFIGFLEGLPNSDGVVGAVAQHEESRLTGTIDLFDEGLLVEAVELNRTGVFLALVELFPKALGEHLVDS